MKIRYKSWIMALAMTGLICLGNMISAMKRQREWEDIKINNQETLLHLFKGLPQDLQRQIVLFKIANFLMMPKTLVGHTSDIWAVATAGDKVVTGSADTTAKVWDINTGQLLRTFGPHDEISSVAIAGDIGSYWSI